MASQDDYWSGWKDGWAAATKAIFSQHPMPAAETATARPPILEMSRAEAAGDKPAAERRGRGRPPKAATPAAATPSRKRGRPRKTPAPARP